MSSRVKRDHHTWTRNTIKNISGPVTLDMAGDLTVDVAGGQFNIVDNTTGDPDLILKSIHSSDSSAGPKLTLLVTRDGSYNSADDDTLGEIIFRGQNADDTAGDFAQIKGLIETAAAGSEKGRLELLTLTEAAGGSSMTAGLKLIGSTTNDEVDVTIGAGADSLTTIAGNIDIDGDTITSVGALEIDAGGAVSVTGQRLSMDTTKGLYFDGGGDTYIYESAGDVLRIVVGGDILLQLSELGDDGNEISFGSSCAGFVQKEPTYNSSNTIVDFRHSNKQFLTFGSGNITNLSLNFPSVSGNFTLLIKQDGTGSRTITNYKAMEFDESSADGASAVKFPGGSNPTLTTAANHVDILSFYWDADNEIAYGVATLDFQD